MNVKSSQNELWKGLRNSLYAELLVTFPGYMAELSSSTTEASKTVAPHTAFLSSVLTFIVEKCLSLFSVVRITKYSYI